MTPEEFLIKWRTEEHAYRAWGDIVRQEIESRLEAIYSNVQISTFIKIPAEPRLKTDDSLLEKAFLRAKNYEEPYLEIEDKIGIRFVVLLTSDILKIQKVVEISDLWSFSLDKDYEAEQEQRPTEFNYQSKHYVVKCKKDIIKNDVKINEGTPCEIQIRTLLQHAHSELTHDNIYKKEKDLEISKKVRRAVAKSMALIEAVDDYFMVAITALDEAGISEKGTILQLQELFKKYIGKSSDSNKSSPIIIEAYHNHLENLPQRIEAMITSRPYVPGKIKEKLLKNPMYRQPWILLAYLMVSEAPRTAAAQWPFPEEELRPIFIDLGKTPS